MIPGRKNSQWEAGNTQHDPGPVQGTLDKKEMITGELNNQRDTSTTQHGPGPVEDATEEKEMILGGRRPATTNRILTLLMALWRKRGILADEMFRGNFSNHQTIHIKSHAMEIIYHCALCGSEFKFSNHLKKHMKSHPGKNACHCAMCGKCLISWNDIQGHMKSYLGPIYISVRCGARNSSPG